jgi:hypothetical protein
MTNPESQNPDEIRLAIENTRLLLDETRREFLDTAIGWAVGRGIRVLLMPSEEDGEPNEKVLIIYPKTLQGEEITWLLSLENKPDI